MSRAPALVAVMGKLHGEEGHTQLESGKSVGGGWQEMGREVQKEREKGTIEAGPTGQEVN